MRENWGKATGIFLLVAGVYGMTLNSWNADKFSLQNATVAALTERGSFALADQVIPGFNLVEGAETFRFKYSIYPMKQPGQTILGTLIYWPLYQLGINFQNHFHYVSHLITFFTSSLMMAGVATLLFLLAFQLTKQTKVAMGISLIFAFGTIIWPYAGVSHHDIYGTFWGVLAFGSYYIARKHKEPRRYLWVGIFSTFALFFTMLPLTMPMVMWGITYIEKKTANLKNLTLGMIVGLLPTLIFNQVMFGNPWLPPNLAGKVADTMPLLSLPNFLSKLWFYLGSPTTAWWAFMPVLIFGMIGISRIPKKDKWLKYILCWLPLAQLIHISTMQTFGGYQYGPRYLLTVLPYLSLGIVYWIRQKHAFLPNFLFILAGSYSVIVGALGAVRTVMYEVPGPYAPGVFIYQLLHNEGPQFRMLIPGLILVLISGVWFYRLKQAGELGKEEK